MTLPIGVTNDGPAIWMMKSSIGFDDQKTAMRLLNNSRTGFVGDTTSLTFVNDSRMDFN
ncbi:hypothetical protein [Rubinisphaera margarita]|uniref:hypothetical protein n=1 Tax=Rubinisphaera margarita TaxID=2909586 RepID=UPI001EE98312|nr:hypothetical protein [Rubinisphaera margarita]MCG6158344.1 hypothetical protein [Rubinisphaera margarita]